MTLRPPDSGPEPGARRAPSLASPRRLINLAQAAEVLGVSIPSVRRLIWAGTLPIVRFNRRLLIDLRDLDRLIDQAKDRGSW